MSYSEDICHTVVAIPNASKMMTGEISVPLIKFLQIWMLLSREEVSNLHFICGTPLHGNVNGGLHCEDKEGGRYVSKGSNTLETLCHEVWKKFSNRHFHFSDVGKRTCVLLQEGLLPAWCTICCPSMWTTFYRQCACAVFQDKLCNGSVSMNEVCS